MDTLPIEIFGLIFLNVVPSWDATPPYPDVVTSEHPTYLGHWDAPLQTLCLVSKSWRQLIHSTPSLWSLIHITQFTPPSRIKRRLDLARSATLDVVIKGLDDDSDTDFVWDSTSNFAQSLALLKSESHRWRRLHIPDTIMDEDDIREIVPATLPELVEARIGSTHIFPSFPPAISAPSLRRLFTSANGCPPFLFNDCSRLTHIRITEFNDDDWVEGWESALSHLASTSPNLQVLHVDGLKRHPSVDGEVSNILGPQISFANLTQIHFNRVCYGTFAHLIRRLAAPSLEVIDLRPRPITNVEDLEKVTLPPCRLRLRLTLQDASKLLEHVANPEDAIIEMDAIDAVRGFAKNGGLGGYKREDLERILRTISWILPGNVQVKGPGSLDVAIDEVKKIDPAILEGRPAMRLRSSSRIVHRKMKSSQIAV